MATKQVTVWYIAVPPTGRDHGEVGPAVGGDLCFLPPKYSQTLHFYQAHFGPVPGGGSAPGDKGVEAVVGAGLSRTGGDV